MNTLLSRTALLIGAVSLIHLTAFAEENPSSAPEKKETRTITVRSTGSTDDSRERGGREVHHLQMLGYGDDANVAREPSTFLGVETAPVSPALGSQLGLTTGTGLVVTHVVKDSPAAAVLKEHDVLTKLDDQILIEMRQLAVLIRMKQPGDEIQLSFIRGGKPQTAKVKLVKRDLPVLSSIQSPRMEAEGLFKSLHSTKGASLGTVLHESRGPIKIIESHTGSAPRAMTINPSSGKMLFNDDSGSIEVTFADGKKTVLAKDVAGKVLFTGPANTSEELKALPENVRAKVESLETMDDFSFKVDGDFVPAEPRVAPPAKRPIGFPLHQVSPQTLRLTRGI